MATPTIVHIKFSGEAPVGPEGPHDIDALARMVRQAASLKAAGYMAGFTIGGGNLFRKRVQGDHLGFVGDWGDWAGMCATLFNALVYAGALAAANHKVVVMAPEAMPALGVLKYSAQEAIRYMRAGYFVVFALGTGLPLFTTDSGAVMRACETGAIILIKVLNSMVVKGVYTLDPIKHPHDAEFLPQADYREALALGLKVMDSTAISLAMDQNLKIRVIGSADSDDLVRAADPKASVGSLIADFPHRRISAVQYRQAIACQQPAAA